MVGLLVASLLVNAALYRESHGGVALEIHFLGPAKRPKLDSEQVNLLNICYDNKIK